MTDSQTKTFNKMSTHVINQISHPTTNKVRDYEQHSITMRMKEGHQTIINNLMVITEKIKKNSNGTEAIKLILNYYQKYNQFLGTAKENWRTHISQFVILGEEYKTDNSTRSNHFAHSLKTLW